MMQSEGGVCVKDIFMKRRGRPRETGVEIQEEKVLIRSLKDKKKKHKDDKTEKCEQGKAIHVQHKTDENNDIREFLKNTNGKNDEDAIME